MIRRAASWPERPVIRSGPASPVDNFRSDDHIIAFTPVDKHGTQVFHRSRPCIRALSELSCCMGA
ncbi:hypothetical protein GCM10010218_00630 [Streptomyces mashuensis]|uniref:Uncharacterized protein n=1 Tax=Streptomyces mashuensis TaxID=33904 RepID=A0A919ARU1_9ACTN|nr:hypothetical protein GCM10010218_00630 [Streptomyces mashuensis]